MQGKITFQNSATAPTVTRSVTRPVVTLRPLRVRYHTREGRCATSAKRRELSSDRNVVGVVFLLRSFEREEKCPFFFLSFKWSSRHYLFLLTCLSLIKRRRGLKFPSRKGDGLSSRRWARGNNCLFPSTTVWREFFSVSYWCYCPKSSCASR